MRLSASGSREEVSELLYKGVQLDSDYQFTGGISPLMLAIAAKDREMELALVKAGHPEADMSTRHANLAEAFAATDLADVVRHIAAGADVNTRLHRGEGVRASSSGTPLHACCAIYPEPGAYEVTVLLLRRRADASLGDAEGDSPLAHAQYFKATELYALLEENGAKLAGPYYR